MLRPVNQPPNDRQPFISISPLNLTCWFPNSSIYLMTLIYFLFLFWFPWQFTFRSTHHCHVTSFLAFDVWFLLVKPIFGGLVDDKNDEIAKSWNNLLQKQNNLIKHTLSNKLASTPTHALYVACRRRRGQVTISRKLTWSLMAASQKRIRLARAKDATRTTTTIRNGGTTITIKYLH